MQKRSLGSRIWLIIIAVLIVAGAIAYFSGTALERARCTQEAASARQRYAALKTQLQAAQAQIATLQSLNRLFSANIWVYRAMVALDDRNFGTANDDVAKAVVRLHGVDAAAAGLNGNLLMPVLKEASGVKIAVATNLESQRAQILKLASDINALIGLRGTKTTSTP
jgi:GAF domain-containing protein